MAFLLYFAGIFVFAAVFSYPVYLAADALFEAPAFEKAVFRSMEIGALLGLWPLLRTTGLRGASGWGFRRAGPGAGGAARRLAMGFAIGVLTIVLPCAIVVLCGARVPLPAEMVDLGYLARLAVLASVVGLVIAAVEELWFRGALFSVVDARAGAATAIASTSLLYAFVHFVRPDVSVPAADAGLAAALTVMAGSFDRLAELSNWDSALALAAAGWLLCEVRIANGWIVECIGIHAGWVVAIRLVKKTTELDPGATAAFLVGRYDGVIGIATTAVFVACASWVRLRRRGAAST